MTEKRFERVYGDIEVVCIDHQKTGDDKFIDDGDYDKFVDLLNELNDENEQLKKDNKEYIRGLELSKTTSQSWASDVRELRKENYRLEDENEQLKSDNKCYVKRYSELFEDYIAYKKENEQLKHDATVLIQSNQDYRKENEQLKSDVNQCKILIDDLKRQNQKLKGRLNDLGVEYYD